MSAQQTGFFGSSLSTKFLLLASVCASGALPSVGHAQVNSTEDVSDANRGQVKEIVVIAERREQLINEVPQSITAISGDSLVQAGITDATDLARVAPGLNVATTYVGAPIYTLRGIGFVDTSLAGRPTVTIYQDEVPIPFAAETRAAFLDLERVEILKGPQGTLYGANATGGAINLITAEPTDDFKFGADVSYGRFNAFESSGFLSGPLGDNAGARLSVQHNGRSDWQRGYTHDGETGEVDFSAARLVVNWEPTETLKVRLSANGWIDRSDSRAQQLIRVNPKGDPVFIQDLLNYPLAPDDARAADFTLGQDYSNDNNFMQFSARLDFEASDNTTITSISAYSRYKQDEFIDADGTTLVATQGNITGEIESYYQEIRAATSIADRANLTVGFNYSYDDTYQRSFTEVPQSTLAASFLALGAPAFTNYATIGDTEQESWAVFGAADFDITDTFNIYGGIRYTESDVDYRGGVGDSGDGVAAEVFTIVENFLRSTVGLPPLANPIPPGGIIVMDENFNPGTVVNSLSEDNISWRAGGRWTPTDDVMVYANVSRGYKLGTFPQVQDLFAGAYVPARQESVLAYEGGFRLGLAGKTLQLNGAVFHYDYTDKQILGRVVDPIFGTLVRLTNIPTSSVTGAELDITWLPVEGLTIRGAATYLDAKVTSDFFAPDPQGPLRNFNGENVPNTPEWQFQGSIDYQWPISKSFDAFIGSNIYNQSGTSSFLGDLPLQANPSYTLVDLRAGIEAPDGDWRFSVWGRNIFNEFYWTFANEISDTSVRITGMPVTYGVAFSFRF